MLKIAVIDGQGGGIGRRIIETVRREVLWDVRIIALGTNSLATAEMAKAGANLGATGENAIVDIAQIVDLILGPVGIIIADAMNGEITETMASAVSGSLARKLLIPYKECNIEISGIDESLSLSQIIDQAIWMVKVIDYEKKQTDSVSRRE